MFSVAPRADSVAGDVSRSLEGIVLRATGLVIEFGGVRAVNKFSVEIPVNERVALIGPNGAGKSSVINALAGVVRPTRGSVYLDGRDVTHWSTYRRARAGLGRTFQNLESFGSMSVRESLLVGLEANRAEERERGRGADLERLAHLVEELGLAQYGDRAVGQLPYGARKLVEVGRALARQPKVLLLDEPAAGLDSREKVEFLDKLDYFLTRMGTAVLLVEHDMPTVERLCTEHTLVLDGGNVIAEGTFASVTADARVIEAYLGVPRS